MKGKSQDHAVPGRSPFSRLARGIVTPHPVGVSHRLQPLVHAAACLLACSGTADKRANLHGKPGAWHIVPRAVPCLYPLPTLGPGPCPVIRSSPMPASANTRAVICLLPAALLPPGHVQNQYSSNPFGSSMQDAAHNSWVLGRSDRPAMGKNLGMTFWPANLCILLCGPPRNPHAMHVCSNM
jgi:hypothetical protein